MLNELRDEIHKNAVDHGFYEEEKVNIPERLMLIVSELGEAMEAYRREHYADIDSYEELTRVFNEHELLKANDFSLFEKYMQDTFEIEIIDTIIRLFDLCGFLNIDIDELVKLKMQYNASRPYKHGKIC